MVYLNMTVIAITTCWLTMGMNFIYSLNSLIVAVCVTAGQMALSSLASFAFS